MIEILNKGDITESGGHCLKYLHFQLLNSTNDVLIEIPHFLISLFFKPSKHLLAQSQQQKQDSNS